MRIPGNTSRAPLRPGGFHPSNIRTYLGRTPEFPHLYSATRVYRFTWHGMVMVRNNGNGNGNGNGGCDGDGDGNANDNANASANASGNAMFGWHYLSNATACPMRRRLFYALFVVFAKLFATFEEIMS